MRLGLTLDSHGAHMSLTRGSHRAHTGLTQGSYGVHTGLTWGSYGAHMGLTRAHMGSHGAHKVLTQGRGFHKDGASKRTGLPHFRGHRYSCFT